MAAKAINDFVGPDGLVKTLLVFGALSLLGLPRDRPRVSTFQRAAASNKATVAMSKHLASRRIRASLNTRNDPDYSDIHEAETGSPALVYLPEKDQRKNSYSILNIDREGITVISSKGAQKFRSTVVNAYL